MERQNIFWSGAKTSLPRNFAFVFCTAFLITALSQSCTAKTNVNKLRLPPGFEASIFSDSVPGARSMAISPSGTLFVGTIGPNCVYALPDSDSDGKADRVVKIASGLNRPNGVEFRDGSLYVAEVHRILRYDNIEQNLDNPPAPVELPCQLPKDQWHGYKYIKFGPDGLLYVPVGAPCNVCERLDDERYATITRLHADDSKVEVFARGVRNTVGFDWHPLTGDLWFTDNGRDHLGDDLPPDELNRASQSGLHFGFPYRFGKNQPDPEFGERGGGIEFTPPAQELGAHVAALGMCFYRGSMFPQTYRNGRIFIAEHGSWNRSKKIGYRISMVSVDESGNASAYETFCDGWLDGEDAWGRPVDVLCTADGALLVSDDRAGTIYRISYKQK